VTLLPPLKHIRSFKLVNLSKLPIFDPQPKAIEPPVVSDPAPVVFTPSEILQQIGSGLRQWREHYGLSIEDISAQTQIQPRLIQAIEAGQIEMLPETVYVRGLIKRYGDRLGLDGAAIARNVPTWQREAADFTAQTAVTRIQTSFSTPRIDPFYVYLGYTLLIVGTGAGISHLLNDAFKPKSAVLLPKIAVTQKLATSAPASLAVSLHPVKVGITVKQPAWAQIGIDGATKFTGNLNVGTQLNWVAEKQITISTNNAGALLLSRDGQPAQPVGKIGEKQQVTIKMK
jgi:hypothetical protein